MTQGEVVRDEPLKLAPRSIRPPDIDAQDWALLSNLTRSMLVKKYGPTVEQWKASQTEKGSTV
jgi:hypothetical protein